MDPSDRFRGSTLRLIFLVNIMSKIDRRCIVKNSTIMLQKQDIDMMEKVGKKKTRKRRRGIERKIIKKLVNVLFNLTDRDRTCANC